MTFIIITKSLTPHQHVVGHIDNGVKPLKQMVRGSTPSYYAWKKPNWEGATLKCRSAAPMEIRFYLRQLILRTNNMITKKKATYTI